VKSRREEHRERVLYGLKCRRARRHRPHYEKMVRAAAKWAHGIKLQLAAGKRGLLDAQGRFIEQITVPGAENVDETIARLAKGKAG
jgi:hypothetical protein